MPLGKNRSKSIVESIHEDLAMSEDSVILQQKAEAVQNEQVQQMKIANHNLKLNDAIVRNKIRKSEKEIEDLKAEQQTIMKEYTKFEK